MNLLLVIGAIAAVCNLALSAYNIYLAAKRTRMQHDLHKWKKEHIQHTVVNKETSSD